MNLTYKHRQHQTVFRALMTVVGTELADRLHRHSAVVFRYIQKPF